MPHASRPRVVSRSFAIKTCILMASVGLAILINSPASASMPGQIPGTTVYTNPYSHSQARPHPIQDPVWLVKKNAFEIHHPSTGKTIPNTLYCPPSCPSSYELDTSTVYSTIEPAAVGTDDAGHSYTNYNMVNLCVPGALTNALSYWGRPVASWGTNTVTDISVQQNNPPGVTKVTTWKDSSPNDSNINPKTAHRSYMLHLAWQINPSNPSNPSLNYWPEPGVMDFTQYRSLGATLYDERDAANWEASGDSSNWSNYFYTIVWWNGSGVTKTTLLNEVESDIYNDQKPVLAEVDASDLTDNWPNIGLVKHAITIIGYNNNSGIYYYTDSCGSSTGCGAYRQQNVWTASEGQMWKAIIDVPVDPSPYPGHGDGGWIW